MVETVLSKVQPMRRPWLGQPESFIARPSRFIAQLPLFIGHLSLFIGDEESSFARKLLVVVEPAKDGGAKSALDGAEFLYAAGVRRWIFHATAPGRTCRP